MVVGEEGKGDIPVLSSLSRGHVKSHSMYAKDKDLQWGRSSCVGKCEGRR